MPTAVLNAPTGFDRVARLAAWQVDGHRLIAEAETAAGATVQIVFSAVHPAVWHLRLAPAGDAPLNLPLVVGEPNAPVPLEADDDGRVLAVRGPALSLEITRDPWSLAFRDAAGRAVCAENPTDVDGLGRFFVRPLGFVRGAAGSVAQVSESFALRADEHLFGLGEKFTPLDKVGQRIVCWTVDPFGSTTERSHKNVPFLWSTRGYGLFLNTGRRSTFELGCESCQSYTVTVDGPYLDAYLIYGPAPADILKHYTALVGRAPVPPKWSFGLWMSGGGAYRDEEAILRLAEGLEEHDIPCDVIHVDTWWLRWRRYCDFRWDEEAFPEPQRFAEALHRQGLALSVWQHPYISVESDLFDVGRAQGYFVRRPDGEVYVIDYGLSLAPRPGDALAAEGERQTWNAPVAIIDVTNPAAVEWYKGLMRTVLEGGVDVFKTDFGEDIPADAVFANGLTGAEMHNLYPLYYNRAVFEVTRECKGQGLVWSRSGYAGSQRYPTCWSGDPAADWASLACTIRGGLSLGLSGVPFWSNDIGAYRWLPSPRLYVRWAQFGLLCPHARCHGESQREPWFFGPEALSIFRRYARLRYQLFPYLYSLAHEAAQTGLPVLRAMPLAFPDDPLSYGQDLQYMLGPWLLVAPVYDEGDERTVYLPEGRWFDYWTDRAYDGPASLRVQAPLNTLPLFVRAGAIIPMMAPAKRIPRGPIDWLLVDVYPAGESSYRLLEDEGPTELRCTCEPTGLAFESHGPLERQLTVRFHGLGLRPGAAEPGELRIGRGGLVQLRLPRGRSARATLRW